MNQNNELAELALRISSIEARNRRVELDKAWELSRTRKVSILVLTYLVMILVFWSLGNEKYALNAIVPTLGFFISTASLPKVKAWWQRSKDD
ncbi:MAG: hypothetical protein ACK5GN_11145 [Pseudomonadota bacterium]|jgi:hypothetical protein